MSSQAKRNASTESATNTTSTAPRSKLNAVPTTAIRDAWTAWPRYPTL
jgi:hypothetical protein